MESREFPKREKKKSLKLIKSKRQTIDELSREINLLNNNKKKYKANQNRF